MAKLNLRTYTETLITLSGEIQTAYKTSVVFDFIVMTQEALSELNGNIANYVHGILLNHLLDDQGKGYNTEQDHVYVTNFVDSYPDTAEKIAQAIFDLSSNFYTPPKPAVPDYVQPTGAHDAYSIGDQVNYNGRIYESLINGNVWTPETYSAGWKVIE